NESVARTMRALARAARWRAGGSAAGAASNLPAAIKTRRMAARINPRNVQTTKTCAPIRGPEQTRPLNASGDYFPGVPSTRDFRVLGCDFHDSPPSVSLIPL